MQEFDIPFGFGANDVIAGPDGNLWYTSAVRDGSGGRIGRITPQGVSLPSFSFGVPLIRGLVTGPDGNVWAGDIDNGAILKISPTGQLLGGTSRRPAAAPLLHRRRPERRIWFAESGESRIAQITTQGQITEYPTLTPDSGITDLGRPREHGLVHRGEREQDRACGNGRATAQYRCTSRATIRRVWNSTG